MFVLAWGEGRRTFAPSMPRMLGYPIETRDSEFFWALTISQAILGATMGLELGLYLCLVGGVEEDFYAIDASNARISNRNQ